MRKNTLLKCEYENCKKTFKKYYNFLDHLRIHTKEKPYKCQVPNCYKSFNQKGNLKKHMQTHKFTGKRFGNTEKTERELAYSNL